MVLQYSVAGIQNISHMAVTRDDYMRDIDRLGTSSGYAMWNCQLDLPVKLVAISEGGIGGWRLGGGDEHLRIYKSTPDELAASRQGQNSGLHRAEQVASLRPRYLLKSGNICFILLIRSKLNSSPAPSLTQR